MAKPRVEVLLFSVALLTSLLLVACSGSSAESGVSGEDVSMGENGGSDALSLPDAIVIIEDSLSPAKPDAATGTDTPVGTVDIPNVDDVTTTCEPGTTECLDEHRLSVCMADGSGWLVETCGDSASCVDGECVDQACEPYVRECLEDGSGWHTCDAAGFWREATLCTEDEQCVEGTCLALLCEPGAVVCSDTAVLECAADGLSWDVTPCEDGQLCFAGACVDCVNAAQCAEGEQCSADGICKPAPITIVRPTPPVGVVTQPYAFSFEAEGGVPPYTWAIDSGDVPPGLTLSGAGELAGTPSAEGTFTFTVTAADTQGTTAEADATVTIDPYIEGVHIDTSSPLPSGEDGMDYAVQLQASGGTSPYAWMINSGVLPDGLSMDSTGLIAGIPNMDIGDFDFTVRVFDNSPEPTWDQRDFTLTIEIAPLEIIADQEYDLMVTKIIILPLLTFIDGVPLIPYDTQLQARGGLRPYHWSEQDLPSWIAWLIPTSGIPEGLTLAEDGHLSGNVGSADQVITIQIPLTQIELKGFFFMAQVADSQETPDTAQAIYLIPTMPIGGK